MNQTLITSLLLAAMLLAGCHRNDNSMRFYSEIKSVDKLVLAQMTISKMATIDDISLSEAKGMKQTADAIINTMKIGDRVAAYSYDTYLTAYIDLTELEPADITVDENNRVISIILPEIRTQFAGRDLPIREDHYRVTGLRSAIDAKERAAIKERMNESLKAEVTGNPEFNDRIKAEARRKAVAYFETLLGNRGYNAVISFKGTLTSPSKS